jgi:CRP-like cAMP-binding protein
MLATLIGRVCTPGNHLTATARGCDARTMTDPDYRLNRLLALLDGPTYGRIEPYLVASRLEPRQIVMQPEVALAEAWFPLDGALSLIAFDASGSGVEVGSVGPEGVLAVPIILGAGTMPIQAIVQLPGMAATLPADRMLEEYDRREEFSTLINLSMAALFFQTSQSVACNRLHTLRQRTARWLLAMADRYDGQDLPLTHDFLAMMLGTSRPKVSTALGSLGRDRLIDNGRGSVRIRDRPGLERATCECYGIVRAESARLLGVPTG